MSFYRPDYAYDHIPPPPPPLEMPPLPRGPPPSSDMYRFGADKWRRNNGVGDLHQRDEFSYQSNTLAPRYPQDLDLYASSSKDRTRGYPSNRKGENDNSMGSQKSPRNDSQSTRRRGHRQFHATADRPLLRFQRGVTPDQLLGMKDDTLLEKRFLNADDLSDSEEESMVESDSDEHEPKTEEPMTGSSIGEDRVTTNGNSPFDRQDPLLKSSGQIGKISTPRWSNPEYYTALPPPDESQRKKKDVVRLIRKARIVIQNNKEEQGQVVANDDFISLNFSGDQSQDDDFHNVDAKLRTNGGGMPGAPSGPRAFSHLQNLHAESSNGAPASNGAFQTTQVTGPPPSSSILVQDQHQQVEPTDLNGQLKRKRAGDDEYADLDLRRPPKRKRGIGGISNGYVLEEWSMNGVQDPVPWLSQSHKLTGDPGFRLHKEICDFYNFVKPQKYEQVVREELLDRLQKVMKDFDDTCEVRCFGSFAAGLYLPTADMDLVVVSPHFLRTGVRSLFQSSSQMHRLGRYLKQTGIAEHDSIEIISSAKVPIVKFTDRITNLKVDMSFENDTGLIANITFGRWKKTYPALPIIVTVIKQFLMMRGLNEVANGGLGGFSVTCLVCSLLQHIPRVQTGELIPEQHLGEILLEFLDLYGNQFDISRTGIRMEPAGYFDKRRHLDYGSRKADRLAIIDPNKPDNDISGGSRNVMLIFSRLSRAREEIIGAMVASDRPSLLDWMLGGDYNTFLWQRQRLRKLYKARHGSPEAEYLDRDIPTDVHVSTEKTNGMVDTYLSPETRLKGELGLIHDGALEPLPQGLNGYVIFQSEPQSSAKELQKPKKSERAEKRRQSNKRLKMNKLKQSNCHSPSLLPSTPEKDLQAAKKKYATAVDERSKLLSHHDKIKKTANYGTGSSQVPSEGIKSRAQAEKKAARLVDQRRSILFKLEHPEVAATIDVPKYLTNAIRRSITRKWQGKNRKLLPPVGSPDERTTAFKRDENEAPDSCNPPKSGSQEAIPQDTGHITAAADRLSGTSENPIAID